MNSIQKINSLHSQRAKLEQTSFELAVKIGELLVAEKANLEHGEWMPWIKANLVFSWSTAKEYMKLYQESNSQTSGYLDKPKSIKQGLAKTRKPATAKQKEAKRVARQNKKIEDQQLASAANKGNQLLAFEKVRDLFEPWWEKHMFEIASRVEEDELVDLLFGIHNYIEESLLKVRGSDIPEQEK